MAYPDKILAEDEQVVEHLHPHWITLVPATLWFVVLCAAAGFGIAEVVDRVEAGPTRKVLVVVIVVVAIGLLGWRSVAPWLRWRTTHYVFTTHRVLLRRGVFSHVGRDIALNRISDVGFALSLWDRLVGAGTLTIESPGERGVEELRNVPRSEHVQHEINRLIEQDSARRARQAWDDRPGW